MSLRLNRNHYTQFCLSLLFASGLLLLPACQERACAAGPSLRAGAYAMDITPSKLPISVNGNMQNVLAQSAHDRLHARCLVLDDGTTRLAIVICDSCMIGRELMDDAKRQANQLTGIRTDRILIAATHTHSAPAVVGIFQTEPDTDYQRELARKIAEGIAKAIANLVPAKTGCAVGRDPTQVFNRRWRMKPGSMPANPFGRTDEAVRTNPGYQNPGLLEPAGPIDPDVSILSIQAVDGRPIALLANYSLHYVGGFPPLSADYYGVFADRITELVGADKVQPPFVPMMSNGTSGDINNINFSNPPPGKAVPGEKIRLVADSVARAAFAAYRTISYSEQVPLAMAEREIELGVRRPMPEDIKTAKALLHQAAGPPYKKVDEVYARETLLLAEAPPTVKAKLQSLRIGTLGIAAIPCEVFVEIGLDLKQHSPLQPTFTIELANGYNGYLPTPKHHALGGYETWRARSSYLEVEASNKITPVVLELLRGVAK